MKITQEQVKHVLQLARLKATTDEVKEYQGHLEKVLDYMDQLQEVETEKVEPMFSPILNHLEEYLKNKPEREDQPWISLEASELLANAPEVEKNQFKVHAVIEEDS
jgi:aspartyl-tRNA(Asn)/glutamyl-tRNA(Gln) amidotransferase subunit C